MSVWRPSLPVTADHRWRLTDDGEMCERRRAPRQHHERVLVLPVGVRRRRHRPVPVRRHRRHRVDDVQRSEARRQLPTDVVQHGRMQPLAEEQAEVREGEGGAQQADQPAGGRPAVQQAERDVDARPRARQAAPRVVRHRHRRRRRAVHVDDEASQAGGATVGVQRAQQVRRQVLVVDSQLLRERR